MSKDEVVKLIILNMDNYPDRFLKNADKAQIETIANTWHQVFKSMPTEIVMQAYIKSLTECEFPVTVADISRQLKKMKHAQLPDTEKLWVQMIKSATKCLAWDTEPNYDNYREYQAKKQTIFDAMPKQCQEFIGNIDRLTELAKMENAEQFYFYRFRDTLADYEEREEINTYLSGGQFLISEG